MVNFSSSWLDAGCPIERSSLRAQRVTAQRGGNRPDSYYSNIRGLVPVQDSSRDHTLLCSILRRTALVEW